MGGKDTFGNVGHSLCYRCYFAQIQPEIDNTFHINKAIFRKSTYREQNGQTSMSAVSDEDSPPSIHTQPVPTENFVSRLERVAALHKQGAISDDEYAQAKSKLLK